MSTIVVGYDGSATAREAVRQAVRLAEGGRVVVVHAYDAAPPQLNARWRDLLDKDHRDRAQSVLDEILLEGNGELAGAQWEARLEPGSPVDAILNVAREVDADTVVVGSHGYGAMRALLGSVSHNLLRKSDRPVTVIPAACAERLAAEERQSQQDAPH